MQARLADTSQAPFTTVAEEQHALAGEQGVPVVVVTDDVHISAPLVLEEAGLCDPATSCPAIGKDGGSRDRTVARCSPVRLGKRPRVPAQRNRVGH